MSTIPQPKTVIRYANRMIAAFDEQGQQMPEFQGLDAHVYHRLKPLDHGSIDFYFGVSNLPPRLVAADEFMQVCSQVAGVEIEGTPFGQPKPLPWAEEWQRGELEIDSEMRQWVRTRPPSVQRIMLAFPPSCLVSAAAGALLEVPAPGGIGILTSVFESPSDDGSDVVAVRRFPTDNMRWQCKTSDLKVVGYYKGLTPEKLQRILG